MAAPERSLLARLTSNTAIGFLGNSVQRGISLAITLVLARGLGGEGFGVYSYVVSYMFLFAFVADLGTERVVTREVARSPQLAGELIGSAIVVKLGLSLVAMSAAIATAWAIDMPRDAFLCVVIVSVALPMTLEQIYRGYFQSRYQVGYTFAITLPGTIWGLLGAVLVTRFHLPLYWLFAFSLILAPFIVGALIWVGRQRLQLVLRPRSRIMKAMLRDSVELGGVIFLFMLSMRLDQLMLFHMRGDVEVARYAVGVRLSEALGLIPEAVVMTLFPLLASSENTHPERFRETCRLAFKYLSGVSVLVAFALTVLRHQVVAILFGPDFAGAAPALAVLAWNSFFAYVGVVYLSLFLVQARQRLLLFVSTIALAANVALNLAWIPNYGATGAAAATLAANVAGFATWLAVPQTRPFMVTCLQEASRALAAAAVLAAAIWLVSWDGWAAAALIIIAYPALLWLFGGMGWSDVRLIQRLFAASRAAS